MAQRYADAQLWTYVDYARMPADGRRYEIHEGVLWMAPGPGTLHQRVALNLALALQRVVADHSLGEVFIAPYDVVLSDITVVQPDLVFVRDERSGIVTDEDIRGAPDLVVEVLSPGTRRIDRVYKRSLYERAGVPEYWVVDGSAREVTVFTLDARRQRYSRPRTYREGDAVQSERMAALKVDLTEVWA